MKITLKDGSVKEYAESRTVIDIAADISEGLARMACAGEADGEVVDLRTVIDRDCTLNILTVKDEAGLRVVRHTDIIMILMRLHFPERIWTGSKRK